MKPKRIMRAVRHNTADIEDLAAETASDLFDYISAYKGKSRELARALTMDIFIEQLLFSIKYYCSEPEESE